MSLEMLAAGTGQTAHDDVKDFATLAMQFKHDEMMQKRALLGSKALNRQMARLARDARQMSASDQVVGLRAAGLNPALAQGAQFGGISAGGGVPAPSSSPSPAPRGQMGKLTLEALKYEESERELMAAQTANLNAEAESKRLENANKQGANRVSAEVLRTELENVKANSPEYSSDFLWSSAVLRSGELNSGSLAAFHQVMDAVPRITAANYEIVSNKLAQMYSDIKYGVLSGDSEQAKRARDMLRQVDYEQARQIRETTDNIVAQTALLVSEMSKNDKSEELMDKQKHLIDKQIQQLGTLIRATHHKDLVAMYEDGEYLSTSLALGLEMLPALAEGGFVAWLTRLGRGSSRGPSAPSVPTSETFHEQWRYNKNGQPTSYKRTRMSGLSE